METNPTPSHHPPCIIHVDDSTEASRILCAEWHECKACGEYVRNDDTTTVCKPEKVRAYRKFLQCEAKRKVIEARMEARARKFRELQAKDELAIYELRTKGRS